MHTRLTLMNAVLADTPDSAWQTREGQIPLARKTNPSGLGNPTP